MANDSVGFGSFIPNAAGLPKTLSMTPAEKAMENNQAGANEQAVAQVAVQASGQNIGNIGQSQQAQVVVAAAQSQGSDNGGEHSDAGDRGQPAGVDIEV
ncbi:MAG: hypothetical protein QF830_10255 [Rhodospirillales bacterium]|jgi:hypothetical protein|nr:hypothetical protein [Rhodospirillales bacterium]